jgi:hypothetical protein
VTVEVESGLHEVAVRLRSHRTSITVDAAESEVRLVADVDEGESPAIDDDRPTLVAPDMLG